MKRDCDMPPLEIVPFVRLIERRAIKVFGRFVHPLTTDRDMLGWGDQGDREKDAARRL